MPPIIIRRAVEADLPAVARLLYEVQQIHAEGRPDLFLAGTRKYSDEELKAIFVDDTRPVFVAEMDGIVVGYAFCVVQQAPASPTLRPIKELYIDDLCVEQRQRGLHIGTQLYEFVRSFAEKVACDRIILNVWCLNESAVQFYRRLGMKPFKMMMEQPLH